jgi:intein-encoded DNA endonuclease-like protein
LEVFLEEMRDLPTKVVFVTQPPVSNYGERTNFRAVAEYLTTSDDKPPVFHPDKTLDSFIWKTNEVAEELARKYPNFEILHAGESFRNADGSIRYAQKRKFFYLDDDHLSNFGTEDTRPLFEEILEKAINNKTKP